MPAALLALLAGACSVLAYAPFGLWPLAFVSLGALFALWQRAQTSAACAWLGFCWGLGAFFAGIGWLIVALHVYGGMPLPLAILCILLFAAFLALYPTFAGLTYSRLRGEAGQYVGRIFLLAGVWTLNEALRGWLFTGFPWLAVGYTQTDSPLAGFAPVFGVYGIGFIVALISAAAAVGGSAPRRAALTGAIALTALATGYALHTVAWTHPTGEPIKVALVQTNIPQNQKWNPTRLADTLSLNEAAIRTSEADLIALPETALPMFADQLPEGYFDALEADLRSHHRTALLGMLTRDDTGMYNSAVTLGANPAQRYSKQHLVPFGEYQPPLFGWFFALAHIPMAGLTPGPHHPTPLTLAGQRVAVNICYEDLFGEELTYALPEATMMLNMSNLAWYGDYHAQPQHLQIARMRALETGRPMLRSTNTGMTAAITPDGHVSAALPAFTRGTLLTTVTGYTGLTPFARGGNLPTLAIAGLCLAACMLRRHRPPQAPPPAALTDDAAANGS